MSYFAKIEEKRRLKKLYDETKTRYGAGAWWNEKKSRYIRYYPYSVSHNIGIKKFYRKLMRSKLNENVDKEILPQRSGYKKHFDLWWTLT